MKTKLIQTKDYLLLIDEEAEIKKGDYILEKELIINIFPNYLTDLDECSKIIAYYPLTKEAKELDLPLLPNPSKGEIDIEKLAKEHFPDKSTPGYIDHWNLRSQQDFIEGYKAAQSDKQFSLEDVKKAIDLTQQICDRNADYVKRDRNVHVPMITIEEEEEIIQSLSTQQLPKEFVPETEVDPTNRNNWYVHCPSGKYWEDKPVPPSSDRLYTNGTRRLKTTTNSEGKQELVGIYKY